MIRVARRTRGSSGSTLRLASLLLALVPACAVGPDYVEPEPEAPDVWQKDLLRGLKAGEGDLRTWWTQLDDPVLDGLVARASEGSLDLQQAVARVQEARSVLGIAKGDWFPSVDAIGSAQQTRLSKAVTDVVPPPATRNDSFFSAGIDSLWEVDLFGRIRRSVESARASYEASIEDYRDVLVVLYAEVALQYVEIRTLQERIRLAEKNVELQGETLQLTRDRNAAGLVGDLDVRQAELNLATTEAFIPVLRTSLAEAIHRVGVLLGELPSTLYAEFADPARIPAPPEEIMIGLPTNLLRQRPDIRSAERALAAQTAKIGVATADLYPRLALLGTFEFQALRGHDLIKGSSGAYAYGPSIQWNIFDGGRIRNRIRAEDARTEGALALYENTVLRAFEEVENAIVSYVQESDRRDALARSVVAAREAVELVDTLYRTGLTDFQNVLDTQRSLFAQEDELARSEGFVTQGLIRIYKALGGGWSPPTPTTTP